MILTIISIILNGLALYLHLTAENGLALAILIMFIVPMYAIGGITAISSFISSIIKKFKPIRFILSIISIGISAYGLITLIF